MFGLLTSMMGHLITIFCTPTEHSKLATFQPDRLQFLETDPRQRTRRRARLYWTEPLMLWSDLFERLFGLRLQLIQQKHPITFLLHPPHPREQRTKDPVVHRIPTVQSGAGWLGELLSTPGLLQYSKGEQRLRGLCIHSQIEVGCGLGVILLEGKTKDR